jgi:hypothetical protein
MTVDVTPPARPLETAVLFMAFNRPETTSRVFDAIRKARPPRLYVAADGPRADRIGETARVERVRKIATEVDWPCEMKTLFRKDNLGCKQAVSGAITWFFENEEEGIILEDDCLPHPDFFNFCETMLDYYRNDERVDVITGNNFQNGQQRGAGAYYFSKYNHCWGWASWRRAWRHYQGDLPFWPEWRGSDDWKAVCPDNIERRYWERIFDQVYAGAIDTWDYPWTACVWTHRGLTATPNVNLVTNIGFGVDATHTCDPNAHQANMPVAALPEIVHPQIVKQDKEADAYIFDRTLDGRWLRWPWSWVRFPIRVIKRLARAMKTSARYL